MPVTRIKTDGKSASGCKQMATDAAVVLAAVMECFITEIATRAYENRRKGHTSISAEVVVDVVTSDPDFVPILGANPVFVTGAKKVVSKKRKAEGEEPEKKKKKN